MGEKITPATDSTGLLRVTTLRESLELGLSSGTAHGSTPDPDSIAIVATQDSAKQAFANQTSDVPLRIEKAYLEQIIENAPEAITIVDEEHHILRINGEFTRLFGYTATEVTGQSLDQLIVPPDRYAETAWISQSVKGGNNLSLETRRQAQGRLTGRGTALHRARHAQWQTNRRLRVLPRYLRSEARRGIQRRALRHRRPQPDGRGSPAVLRVDPQHRGSNDVRAQFLHRDLRSTIPAA